MNENETAELLDHCRPSRVWRSLDGERRKKAAAALWGSDHVKPEELEATVTAIAEAKRFRIQSIRTAPPARRAAYLAGCATLPDHVASAVLYAYHMADQLPLMCRFLDELEITHEEGRIEVEFEPPGEEALAKAAEALLADFDRRDVLVYMKTLLSQDPEGWGALAGVLGKFEEASAPPAPGGDPPGPPR